MKKISSVFIILLISISSFGQKSSEAKKILDEVSAKMSTYKNMYISFSSSLTNKDAGINENDEPPMRGTITLQGEKYSLDYMGNKWMYDGKNLYIINPDEKEVNITSEEIDDDGFIYPSKLLTFYKEGYNYSLGKLKNFKGRKVQFIDLDPIDSNSDIVKVKLGIDAKTKHIYKMIQIGKNGSKTTLTITKFKSNLPISKKLFTFDKEKYLKQDYTID